MDEPVKVQCPECNGEGMKKHCGWTACLACKGMGELTEDEYKEYQKNKKVTIAELMHPASKPRG